MPEDLPGSEEVYGIEFGEFQGLDAGGPLTVGALLDGDADVANVFSTDTIIEEEGLVVLEDPEGLYLAQNILPVGDEEAISEEAEEQLDAAEEFLTEHGIVG